MTKNINQNMLHKTMIPIIIFGLGTITKRLVGRLEELEIEGRTETLQTTAIPRSVKIICPGDLGRLAPNQTRVKDHQLTLM